MVRSEAAFAAARLEPWAKHASGTTSAALILRDALAKRVLLRMRTEQGRRVRRAGISNPLRQILAELGADARVELLARPRLHGKRLAPRPRAAGVDDDAGVARVVMAVGHRVERGAPGAADHLHALARIEARA